MANLSTAAELLKAFYRAVGTVSADAALTEQGEAADEVAYTALNSGIEEAQLFVLSAGGFDWWEKRSSAISWSGTDSADGGRYWALPSDFLRLAGNRNRPPLIEADGDPWYATEVSPDRKDVRGDYFYIRGIGTTARLWIAKDANPPTTLYLEYIYKHPEFIAGVTLEFPEPGNELVVAYAARYAVSQGWYPGDGEMEARLLREVERCEAKVRKLCRRSRGPRHMTPPRTVGTRHWVS